MNRQKGNETAGMRRIGEGKRPRWEKGARFERRGVFTLQADAHAVFPLLCPVLEYDWLPGWSCVMRYSESGVAEKDAIFTTREALGRKTLWTTITCEPDAFIEYLIVSGTDAVVRLSVRLKSAGTGKTEVDWRMRFTSLSTLGRMVLEKTYSEEKFRFMMKRRKEELGHFLAAGTMIGTD